MQLFESGKEESAGCFVEDPQIQPKAIKDLKLWLTLASALVWQVISLPLLEDTVPNTISETVSRNDTLLSTRFRNSLKYPSSISDVVPSAR